MKLSDLFLDRFLYRDNKQDLETKGAAFVAADSSDSEGTPIYSGGAAQDINTGNVKIDGEQLEPGTYPVTILDVANWGWGQTCAFSSTDLDTVSWGAGTFTSADGTSYSIGAGNTGNMAGLTYIYLSLLDSEIVYQHTTTPADAVGAGKVLIAVAENSTTNATYMLSEATQIVGDNIIANTINATKIKSGSISTTQLSFTPLYSSSGTGSVIATINASAEGLNISADKIYISGSTTFASGYNPNDKIDEGAAASDINSNFTTINGGKIRTGKIESTGYSYTGSLTPYSNIGTQFDLDNGLIRSKNFVLDAVGNAFFAGNISAAQITTGILSVTRTEATYGATIGTNLNGGSTNNNYINNNGYITNINAGSITTGILSVGGDYQPSAINLYKSNINDAKLNWKNEFNSTIGKIWTDGTGYMGYNSVGGRHYFYTSNYENVVIQDFAQTWFNYGISCRKNFNVTSAATYARFEGVPVYFYSSGINNRIQATSTVMSYEANDDHFFYVNGNTSIDAIIDANIWSNGDIIAGGDVTAGGSKPFVIPHPDGSDRLLRYTAQESPEVILRHRGKAKTDSTGKVTIKLPAHFTLVTDKTGDVTVNLTPIGNNHLFLQKEPTNAEIKVESNNPDVSFHYEVMAIRDGYLNAPVELDINDKKLSGGDKTIVDAAKKIKKIKAEEEIKLSKINIK